MFINKVVFLSLSILALTISPPLIARDGGQASHRSEGFHGGVTPHSSGLPLGGRFHGNTPHFATPHKAGAPPAGITHFRQEPHLRTPLTREVITQRRGETFSRTIPQFRTSHPLERSLTHGLAGRQFHTDIQRFNRENRFHNTFRDRFGNDHFFRNFNHNFFFAPFFFNPYYTFQPYYIPEPYFQEPSFVYQVYEDLGIEPYLMPEPQQMDILPEMQQTQSNVQPEECLDVRGYILERLSKEVDFMFKYQDYKLNSMGYLRGGPVAPR
jgi:hypothetical protein